MTRSSCSRINLPAGTWNNGQQWKHWKHQNNVWNPFEVDKDARTNDAVLVLLLLFCFVFLITLDKAVLGQISHIIVFHCGFRTVKCRVGLLKNIAQAHFQWRNCLLTFYGKVPLNNFPTGNCMFKVNNRNPRTRCEVSSKLTIKTPERRHSSFALNIFYTLFYCFYC